VQRSQPRVHPHRSASSAAPSGGRRTGGRGRRGEQAGFTLVEVLIALALAGVVVLGLASGLFTLIRTSNDTLQRQQIQVALGNFGESLKAAPYRACDDPAGNATAAAYQSAYDAWGVRWVPRPGMGASIVKVEYWDPEARVFEPACDGPDAGAQRLTLHVTWAGRGGKAQVVKRA